jgi:xanthine dehydrogenase YagS FAD-binding subunit
VLYELPYFEHVDAANIEEALSWLQIHGDTARVIAGGTDLLGMMKDRVKGPELHLPEVLINIKTIAEMNQVTYDNDVGLKIGSAVTLSSLETSDIVKKNFNILSQAARQVGTTPIRNMGTVGGNLCQRPRCLYFRHPHFVCHRKGGTKCYAVTGEHRYYHAIMRHGMCVMAHPSDMAPVLTALKGRAIVISSKGKRQIPLEAFFPESNYFTETVLKPDELLVEILVPKPKERTYQSFLKYRIRRSADFALSSVAVVAHIPDETCEDVKIVLGGVAPFPYVADKAEGVLKGERLSSRLMSKASEASVEGARALPMNRYKVDLTKVSVRRALQSIWDRGAECRKKLDR